MAANAFGAIWNNIGLDQRLVNVKSSLIAGWPFAEAHGCVVHCIGFSVSLALIRSSPVGHTADVFPTFLEFQDLKGWASLGVATLVGLIGPMSTSIGGVSAVHLAKELQEASYILPRATVLEYGIKYETGAVDLIPFFFNIEKVDNSLYNYAGQAWIAVMYRITGSKAATIVIILVVAINFSFL